MYVFLVVLIMASKAVSSSFGTLGFTQTVVALSAFTAVAAFGQFIVVLTGGLDLSIPNVMTAASVVMTGLSLGKNTRVWWVLPVVLASVRWWGPSTASAWSCCGFRRWS